MTMPAGTKKVTFYTGLQNASEDVNVTITCDLTTSSDNPSIAYDAAEVAAFAARDYLLSLYPQATGVTTATHYIETWENITP